MASSPTLTADGEALSPWWVRSVFIVMFVGFAALIGITGLAYHNAPPIPAQVVDDTGQVLFTGEHISNGQEVFLKYGLMNNGTIWGHGGYLGPDSSATALHQIGVDTREAIAQRDSLGARSDERRVGEEGGGAGK